MLLGYKYESSSKFHLKDADKVKQYFTTICKMIFLKFSETQQNSWRSSGKIFSNRFIILLNTVYSLHITNMFFRHPTIYKSISLLESHRLNCCCLSLFCRYKEPPMPLARRSYPCRLSSSVRRSFDRNYMIYHGSQISPVNTFSTQQHKKSYIYNLDVT